MSIPAVACRPFPTPLALFIVVLLVAGCGSKDPVARGTAQAFGTEVEITLIGINRQRAAEVTDILADEFAFMDSAWHVEPPSPLAHVNTLISAGNNRFAAPPSLLPLLSLAQRLSMQSDELFNPTIGRLVRAWGFDSGSQDCLRPPPQELLDTFLAQRPSISDLTIEGFRVHSQNQAVRLNFRDIRRGYAIDRAIARLQELGIHSARVSIDGNMRAIGSRDGHPWSHAIRGPDGGGVYATLEIKGNEAAFTAGNYQSAFSWQGAVYHDILDPRTGYPASETASVTVVHPDASTADAAVTALFIAGPKEWHRLAQQMGLRYVMLTDSDGRVHMNPAMLDRIKLHRANREVIISEPLS
jgi:thiamine biosynthesis lipoprotein